MKHKCKYPDLNRRAMETKTGRPGEDRVDDRGSYIVPVGLLIGQSTESAVDFLQQPLLFFLRHKFTKDLAARLYLQEKKRLSHEVLQSISDMYVTSSIII